MEALLERLEALNLGPWINAVIIVLASLLVGKIADMFLCRVLRRLTAKTRTKMDDQIVSILHRPIFLSVVLFGLSLATHQIGMRSRAEDITVSLLKTVGIFVWIGATFPIIDLVLQELRDSPRFSFIEAKTLPLFNNLFKILAAAGAIYLIITAWRLNPAAWLTSAGIVGIAVGFAAKDTLANLFAGVFILADSPYKVGDYVNLDGGERGEVVHIGIRSTRIVTRDDIEITIPNAVIGNAKIINETGGHSTRERLRVAVAVAYGSDIDRVEEVLLEAVGNNQRVCTDPEPRVRFRSFGDSGLNFELLCWIEEPVWRGLVLHQLNSGIYKGLAAAKIEIPFPKRDLYIKSLPDSFHPRLPESQ